MDIAFFLAFLFAGSSSSEIVRVGEVGTFCDSDLRNLPCTAPNSFCINNICTCAPLYEQVNGECILKSSKTLTSRCKTSAECTGKGEYCNRSSGKCWCLSTHFVLGGKCKPVIYPGQSGCEDSRQCAKGYPGAICTSQNKCQCPKGFKAKAFSCFKSKRYGPQKKRSQPARTNVQEDYSNLLGKTKYNSSGILTAYGTVFSSSCPVQQIFIQELGICMTTRLPGESCQYSEQCAATEPGAFCQKLRCKCAQGMKLNGNSCTFMEPKCAILGYVWVSEMGQCMEVISPGANGCIHSKQCSTAADGAYCSRHKCICPGKLLPLDGTCGKQCPTSMIFSAIVGKCISAIRPGDNCQYSSQCQRHDVEMICIQGICRCSLGKVFTGDICAESCPPGYIVGNNGICRQGCSSTLIEHDNECYDQIPEGQRCLMNSECTGGFRCISNVCVCPSSMIIREGLCYQKEVGPMQSCAYGEVCLGGSYCLAGICVCPAGNIKLNDECIPRATVPPSSTCNSTVQCSGGSSCVANICQCRDSQQSVNGICELLPAVPVGGACQTGNERCLGGSNCFFGICECPLGTILESGKCILERKVLAGSPCNSTQICLGIANCIDGICQCPMGMVIQDGKCHDYTLIDVGASCANGEFCSGGSICTKSICLCPTGTTNQNGICVAEQKKNYDEICINGEKCFGDLLCIDGICQCPQGTFSNSGQCIPITDSLIECSNSSQCAENSYCDHQSGLCTCLDGHQYRNRSCLPMFTRALISPIKICITNTDCIIGAKCIANRCHCPAGEIFMDGRCQMVFAERGESCLNGETCISNYVCINGSCLCPDGELSRDGNCVTEDIEIKRYTSYQAQPNSPCNRGELCIGGSFCNVMDGMCRCPTDTALQNGRCEFIREQSLLTLPPKQIFNGSKDMLRKHSNHTLINITRVRIHMNRCESNDDCKGGSYCFGYRCICPFDMIMKDGLCQRMFPISHKKVDRNHIGRRCMANYDCLIRNTKCHNGMCICLPGYHISEDTECIPTAISFPKTHPQTIIPSVTSAMKNRIAENNQIDEMITNEVIGSGIEIEPDETNLDSTMFTALPLIDAGIGHIPSSRQTEMIVNISGGVCNETTLCLFFSICRNGICKCPLGTRISDTECKFIVDVSRLRQFEKLLHGGYSVLAYATRSTLPVKSRTTHLLPATTVIHPISPAKIITTPSNRAWSIEEVWPTVQPQIEPKPVISMSTSRPGDYCDDGKAYHCTNGSICVENQCVCDSGNVMIDGACVPHIKVRCKTSQQCPSRAQCINGVCSCISGTAMSRYGFCIPINIESSPGMSCTNGETCTGFSKCIRGMCTCPPDRNHIVNNECVKIRPGVENGDCTFDPTICDDGTYCLEGFCVCPTGHTCISTQTSAHQRKLKYVNTGKHCNENDRRIQCSGNSICANGFCICSSGERIINGTCTPINSQGTPGELCEVGYAKCTGNSICIDNYCKCISNQVAINGQCLMQYHLVFPNHACAGNMLCIGGSICIQGVCKCPRGMYGPFICRSRPASLVHANTIVAMEPGSRCVQCASGSVYLKCKWACQHKHSAYQSNSHPIKIPELMDFKNDAKLSVISDRASASVTMVRPGDRCNWTTICGGGSSCVIGRCVCSPNYVLNEERNSCTSKLLNPRETSAMSNPGESCTLLTTCAGGSVCRRGICICPMNSYLFNSICIYHRKAPKKLNVRSPHSTDLYQQNFNCYLNCTVISADGQYVQMQFVCKTCVLSTVSCMNDLCVEGKCACPVSNAVTSDKICDRCYYRFARSLIGQPGYLRKSLVTTPKLISSWQPLKDCPVTGSCLLPNCFCSRSGLEIPGGLLAREVPQIILLTFDGPITDRTFAVYKSLFSGKYRNPNGCPIKGTFFVSSEWNNYDQTQWLISNGHEIAVNSITHQNLGDETVERWKKEMVGMRDALRHFSYASAADIIGVRAPQLELGGDNQFDMMEKFGFLYDNTMSASGGPYWPQTLAYSTAWKCSSSYCPKNAHPNVWEIPINRFTVFGSQKEFTMLKEAVRHDDSPLDVAEMLEMNFNRSYNYNRAPYLLTADNDFLNTLPNEGAIIAFKLFIEKILKNSDVYFVTVTQALKWIKQPIQLLHIHSFEAWQCNVSHQSKVTNCETPSSCSFTCDGKTRILRICGTCPQVYPNLGNPTGTGNSTDR